MGLEEVKKLIDSLKPGEPLEEDTLKKLKKLTAEEVWVWEYHIKKTLKGARWTIRTVQCLNIATYALGFGLIIFAVIHAAKVIPAPGLKNVIKTAQESKIALNTSSDRPTRESSAQSDDPIEEAKIAQNTSPGEATQQNPVVSSTSATEKTSTSGDKTRTDAIISAAMGFSGILITFLNFFLVNPTRRIQKVLTDMVQMGMAFNSYTVAMDNIQNTLDKSPKEGGSDGPFAGLITITKELVELIERTSEPEEEKISQKLLKDIKDKKLIEKADQFLLSQGQQGTKKNK